MKAAVIIFLIFGVFMLTEAYVRQPWPRPRPHTGTFPTFPGQGPFNPRPRWPDAYGRGRRSAAYVEEPSYVDARNPWQEHETPHHSENDPWLASD